MTSIKNYLSLVKFSHTIFALPFALIGFFLGVHVINDLTGLFSRSTIAFEHPVDFTAYFPKSFTEVMFKFVYMLLCMVSARSSAMAFNRWLDKSFDARNPRTAIREIPAGIVSANNALVFVIINCIVFIIGAWMLNPICFYLSPVALFIILFYSYTKRFTPLCHLVLGLGLSLAPIGAYLAITGRFDVLPVLFSFTVLCWVSGFDIIYALQDVDFDKANNLYSIPAVLGKAKALRVSELLHVVSAVLVVVAGVLGHFHWLYWVGVAVFIGMLIYQHSIVKPDDLRRVNLAFMTANGIASVVFACFVLADLYMN